MRFHDRNPHWLKFVRSLPCVVSGAPADDAHHLIGHNQGGMGTKASDYFAFPLTRYEHTALHDRGWKAWEELHHSQWRHVAMTMHTAIDLGVLIFNKSARF